VPITHQYEGTLESPGGQTSELEYPGDVCLARSFRNSMWVLHVLRHCAVA